MLRTYSSTGPDDCACPMLTRRAQIKNVDLAVAVDMLAYMFEVPLHLSLPIGSLQDIKNSFTAFRASELAAALWKNFTKDFTDERPIAITTSNEKKKKKKKKLFAYSVIYTYYRELLQMPALKPWAFFALSILFFQQAMPFQREVSLQWARHIQNNAQK